MNKKSRLNKKRLTGGNVCNATATVENPSCLPTPNVEIYKYPCSALTENQFGMPGMGSISLGGGRSRRRSQKGGSCGGPTMDCLGSNYDTLGKTAISDGAPTDIPTSSELAWFFRNTYGATPSTNIVPSTNVNNTCVELTGGRSRKNKKQTGGTCPTCNLVTQIGGTCTTCNIVTQTGGKKSRNKKTQKGGNVYLDLNDKIGGLSRVNNCYDPFPPSIDNLQVLSPVARDVTVTNIIPYNTRLNGSNTQPMLDQSSLTQNSFRLVGGGKKKKNFLTRNSRHYLFEGGSASQFPNVFNGVQSNFSPDMLTRKFDCGQPHWCPTCT